MDVIPARNGDLTIQQRGERTSFTFRFIRKGECNCVYHDLCDSYKKKYREFEVHTNYDAVAAKLESLHVHEVWTRTENTCWYSKQWFIVPHTKFSLENLKLIYSSHSYKNNKHSSLDWFMTFHQQSMWMYFCSFHQVMYECMDIKMVIHFISDKLL
jgi:hypothetical protein